MVFSGAKQKFIVSGAGLSSMVMWTQASDCTGEGQFATHTETAAFTMLESFGDEVLTLHDSAHSGTWYLCYR